MSRTPFNARLLAAMALALAAFAAAAQSPARAATSETPGWFVLHEPETGNCWTGKLVMMNGAYVRAGALIAGGPFASAADAEARLAELRTAGTCRSS